MILINFQNNYFTLNTLYFISKLSEKYLIQKNINFLLDHNFLYQLSLRLFLII